MSQFLVTGPDGRKFKVTAPEGTTREQRLAYIKSKHYSPKGGAGEFVKGLARSTANTAAGLGQGAAAIVDIPTRALGAVMSLPAEALGFEQAARNFRDPFTIGGAIEKVAPTPQDWGGWLQRKGAELIGGAAALPTKATQGLAEMVVGKVPVRVPAPRPPAPSARSVVDAGRKTGVRVMTSDVRPPRTFMGKAAQTVGERIPLAGTGGSRAAQQAERVKAIRDIGNEYGALSGEAMAAPAINDVMTSLAAKRGAELSRLTGQRDSVVNNLPGMVGTGRTVAAIDQQIARLERIGTQTASAVIGKLKDWRQAVQNKDLPTINSIRKEMGEAFTDASLGDIKTTGQTALNAIYGPMREDMGSFIRMVGGGGKFNIWKQANERLAAMAGELDSNVLRSVLRNGDTAPENVAKMLFSAKPSDVKRLWVNLDDAGKARAQAAILQRAFEKASGAEGLSPDRFINAVKSLGDQVGVFFQGKDAERLNGVVRVLDATRRASQASVAPPTGVQAVPYALGAGFTALTGDPITGAAAAGGVGLLARAYESAATRNILTALGRAKPGSAQEGALLQRLSATVAAAGRPANDTGPSLLGTPVRDLATASGQSGSNEQDKRQNPR